MTARKDPESFQAYTGRGHGRLPPALRDDGNVKSPWAISAFPVMTSFGGTARASLDSLAAGMRCSKKTVRLAQRELKATGWMFVLVEAWDRWPPLYWINDRPFEHDPAHRNFDPTILPEIESAKASELARRARGRDALTGKPGGKRGTPTGNPDGPPPQGTPRADGVPPQGTLNRVLGSSSSSSRRQQGEGAAPGAVAPPPPEASPKVRKAPDGQDVLDCLNGLRAGRSLGPLASERKIRAQAKEAKGVYGDDLDAAYRAYLSDPGRNGYLRERGWPTGTFVRQPETYRPKPAPPSRPAAPPAPEPPLPPASEILPGESMWDSVRRHLGLRHD